MWIAFLIICGLIVGTQSSATVTFQLQMEANAILNSGWWNTSAVGFNISDRCNWFEISCKDDGSIKAINIDIDYPWWNELSQLAATPNLSTLNYSAFNNLESLVVREPVLQGSIPKEIGHLSKLTYLDLSNNSLAGEMPTSLENLTKLTHLDLSHNRLNGNLPNFLMNLTQLEYLDISHNLISGQIPFRIGFFRSLNLSNNNLTGTIPQSLCDVYNYVDISYNCLEGPIANCLHVYTTYMYNSDVCSFNQFQPCSPHKKNNKLKHIVVIVIPILIILVIVFLLLICLNCHHDSSEKLHGNSTKTKNGDMFCIWNYDGKIAYDDIIRATEDFDMRYCIGTGAYGSVYKAQLPSGKVVALKKLHGYEAEVPSFDESFRNEVRILSEIKHKHIVKLYGFCLHKRIMFLIYQYMERGSLFSVLYDDVEAVEFKWRKRVNIVKGIAFALSYLHHDCTAPIVHRDVSSSNILLNSEWQASVCDFGTARLLQYDSSNRTIVAGTIGYIAPGRKNGSNPEFWHITLPEKFQVEWRINHVIHT